MYNLNTRYSLQNLCRQKVLGAPKYISPSDFINNFDSSPFQSTPQHFFVPRKTTNKILQLPRINHQVDVSLSDISQNPKRPNLQASFKTEASTLEQSQDSEALPRRRGVKFNSKIVVHHLDNATLPSIQKIGDSCLRPLSRTRRTVDKLKQLVSFE